MTFSTGRSRLGYSLFSGAMLFLLLALPPLNAQVTTATLYGDVHDSTGAVVPNAMVVAKNQGTGFSKEGVTDQKGEFGFTALPTGTYTVTVGLNGFKTLNTQGLDLGAGQTVRQSFNLEVGALADNITVSETAPLVATASSSQQESIGRVQVSQLPLARRSLEGLATLAPGASNASVGLAGSGSIRLNGVAEGGTAITVDGTDAIANPETRGINQYGGQNQISIMSIDAVAEVQVVKGILPAEYGGVVGGQINILSRSGTNEFHGSAIENYQNEVFFARDTFLPASKAKPTARFNQFGGAIGGPILKNKIFFFATYEGYRDSEGVSLTATVPTQQTRDQLLAALPFPETKLALDPIPLPTTAVNAQIGNYFTANALKRHDNSVMAKGDVSLFGGNLSVTYNRSRPYALQPSVFLNGSDDQNFLNANDRIAAQYVQTRAGWVFETRYGYNKTTLDRIQNFWNVSSPGTTSPELTEVGNRVSLLTISGLFASPSSEVLDLRGRSFSFDQKATRIIGSHTIKVGVNWGRQAGSKTDPQNTNYTYQTLAAALANTPTSITLSSGQPPHDGHLDTYGLFLQDDWRVNKKFVLNMGIRYDYYPSVQIHATSSAPAQIYNLNPPTSLQKMDFGSPRDPNDVYDPDWNNFGPRLGFAWTVDKKGNTVIRGGSGVLFSQQLYAMLQNQVTNPLLPANGDPESDRCRGSRCEVALVRRAGATDPPGKGQRPENGVFAHRYASFQSLHHSDELRCGAGAGWFVDGGDRVSANRWRELPVGVAVSAGIRPADWPSTQSGAGNPEWILHHQRPDDGVQRAADLSSEEILARVGIGFPLHIKPWIRRSGRIAQLGVYEFRHLCDSGFL